MQSGNNNVVDVGDDVFANVMLKKNRYDLLLNPADDVVNGALKSILFDNGVGAILRDVLGPDCELYELAALISDPGSERQIIHPDTPHNNSGCLTCFVSLQDITDDMGPTVFLPRTHNEKHHNILNNHTARDDFLNRTPHKLNLLSTGDASLFDSRTLHAGSANRDKRRVLFYFSFRDKLQRKPSYGTENTGSLKSSLKGKHDLETIFNANT